MLEYNISYLRNIPKLCFMKGTSIAGKCHENFEPSSFLKTTHDRHIWAQFITFGTSCEMIENPYCVLSLTPDQDSWDACSFLGDSRVFCPMRGLWVGLWVRSGHHKDQPWLEAGVLSPILLGSSERRRAGNAVDSPSCPCEEASLEPQ